MVQGRPKGLSLLALIGLQVYRSAAEERRMDTRRHQPERLYPCPCCRHLTIEQPGINDICALCQWEDDGQDEGNADVVRGGPNGSESLTAYRARFLLEGGSLRDAVADGR